MTPEQRLALYAAVMGIGGAALILAALVAAGREHRSQP